MVGGRRGGLESKGKPGGALTPPAVTPTSCPSGVRLMVDQRICSVEGCERVGRIRTGKCDKHYRLSRPPCVIDGCDKPQVGRGWCANHYMRWYTRGGDPAEKLPIPSGADNPGWRGDDVSYDGAHHRLRRLRGKASAHLCAECGAQAHEWAYDRRDPNELHGEHQGMPVVFSRHITHYEPLCRSCHRRRDSKNGRKTHCVRGHEFTPENTSLTKKGTRVCRKCKREKDREYRLAKKAQS